MKPKEIDKLLTKMLGITEGDIEGTYNAWRIAKDLYSFFSNVDAGIYYDDPMSQEAPFECFDKHMEHWLGIFKRFESAECIQAENKMEELELEQGEIPF